MAKSVTVMLRIKAGRTYPLIRVVFSKNGKPKIDPRATSFYLRYTLDGKRKCDAVGSDIDAVLARKIEIESKLRTGAPVGINPTLVAPNLTTITGAANQYFENLAARGLDIKTTHTYRVAVCDFVKSCSKTFVEDINKQDLFNYLAWEFFKAVGNETVIAFRPVTLLLEKHNLASARKDVFGLFPEYTLDVRPLAPHEGAITSGVLVGFGISLHIFEDRGGSFLGRSGVDWVVCGTSTR